MIYITEFNNFYKTNDLVLIHYWYNGMVTPVKILEQKGKKVLISHNNSHSKIKNAPDELISKSSIIDRHKA